MHLPAQRRPEADQRGFERATSYSRAGSSPLNCTSAHSHLQIPSFRLSGGVVPGTGHLIREMASFDYYRPVQSVRTL